MIARIVIVVLLATVAASGTFPYGWQFAELIPISHPVLFYAIAFIFAAVATLANSALGSYSLLHALDNKPNIYLLPGFLAAVPVGFIGFVGYQSLLPHSLNLLISCTIIIVSTGINYTALNNAVSELKALFKKSSIRDRTQFIARILAVIIGVIVSFTFSLASIDRLTSILSLAKLTPSLISIISYTVAFMLWVPNAALFGNSMQSMVLTVFDFMKKKNLRSMNYTFFLIFLFAALSGGAYAQMTLEFTSVSRHIPVFIKQPDMQVFIHFIIVPLAYIAISAVNLIALNKLLQLLREDFSAKRKKKK